MILALVLLAVSLVLLGVTYGAPEAGMARLGVAATLAMVFAAYLTPVVGEAARRFGILDRPDGRLKTHTGPVPYLGGLALGLAFCLSLALVFRFDQRVTGLLLAGAVALLLGLVDDLGRLSWRVKLAGQGLAVLVLLKNGVVSDIAALSPPVNLALSALWLLTLINAFNLIDIADGLAPGVALFASAAFVVVAIFDGSALLAIFAATLFGALAGFLPFNFTPARIYLGDAGSMFLGITLGGISLSGSYTAASAWGLLAPVLILAVPLFDTAFVMAVRLARGDNPCLGSPDHFAVRLRRAGWRAGPIALLACAATVATSAAAITLLVAPPSVARGVVLIAAAGFGLAALALLRVPRPGARAERAVEPQPVESQPVESAWTVVGIDDGMFDGDLPSTPSSTRRGGVRA